MPVNHLPIPLSPFSHCTLTTWLHSLKNTGSVVVDEQDVDGPSGNSLAPYLKYTRSAKADLMFEGF